MKNNSFKRLIASAAIAVLLACNIGDAGTSVVSYAAAATTEQAAEEKTEKAEKAETSQEKEVRKEESETKETPREVTEDSGTDETIKETPEAPAEETAEEETEEKASEAAAGEQEIKEETEEETDQAQDASAAPSEEEEDIAVPAGSTSLTGMIESIQVGPKTGQSTTDVPRDDKVSVSVSYKISDSKVGEAQANPEWEYDLTDMVNDPDGILSSISGAGGEIMQGGSSRGTYRIEDNKVILTITDLNWLNAQESNVSGTFDFSLNLDADKVKDRGGYTFNFPGGGDFHIDFEEVKVSGEKKVGTRYNQQATSDGSNFDVTSEKNDDGTYTLYYSARVKPNATLSGLSMTDTLTGSQTLVAGSIQLNGTAIPSDYISTSGDGFTADLGAYLASTGSSVKKDTDYTVTYQTTIPESALKSGQANTAAFTYAGKTDSFTTNITPVSKKNYDSLVKKSMSADGDGAGAVITYTITVNPEHADMAGMTISDTMTDLQLLEGDITISPAVNGMTTLTPDARFSDDELSTNSYEVFKYTFPSDGTFTDTYTITYKTKIPESSGSIEGKQKVENTVKVEDEDGEGTSHVEDQFTFPGEPYGVGKKFSSWDTDNNVINWTITLTVEEGTTLSNISIQDIPYYGLDQWNINRDAEVLWDEITVTDTDENAVAFTPDPANKSIKFDQVDKTIIIHVPTKSPVSITEQADFWAKNTAQVFMDGKKGKTAEAVKRYVSQTVDMSKNVSYDEASKEWTWTVVINPTNAEFDEDYVPYFTDQLPEGMELADSTITVGCNGGGHTNAQGQVIWGTHEDNPAKVTADVQNGTIQPIDLTKGYPDIYNAWPTGISGMKYTITYKTKLSADEIARIKGNTEEQTYNNVASVTDGTNVKNTAEKETTYKYKFLEKSDNSPEKLDKDIIEYS
ncbi:MAG TPA: hypothetical protein DCR16_04440, partial [Lachnospiraceae bacterium]|nr:hypothetical protein [Lachnospiraceae bacterium]